MKKIYSFISIIIAGASCIAQPTLTASTTNPVIGDNVVKKLFTPIPNQQGNPGANQTWDWSGVSELQTAIGQVISPVGTAYAALYPAANTCFQDSAGAIEYDLGDNTGLYRLGFQNPNSGTSSIYDNSMQILKYPLMYNSTYSDSYHSAVSGPGISGTLDGNVTITADGYGTLITPAGTFTNVLRIHAEINETYDYGFTTIVQIFDQYNYFKANLHFPLAEVITGTSGGNPFNSASWASASVGINEVNAELYKLSVYPNPVIENAEITYTVNKSSEVNIEIMDVTGRIVQTLNPGYMMPGLHAVPVESDRISNGIYFVALTINGETATTKMVVNR
jgi:hypothetical protein